MIHSGRSMSSKTDKGIKTIGNLIGFDCQLTIRMLAETVDIYKEYVRQILHNDFNLQEMCAKIMPKYLIILQKEAH